MLLAIDIGNTNITFGLFEGEVRRGQWRVATRAGRTADEYAVLLRRLLRLNGVEAQRITGCAIASVVPPVTPACVQLARDVLGVPLLVVGPGVRTGMRIFYENPAQLGVDRVVDAVAARHRYGAPVIVIDFGTATTFNVVDAAGDFRGGAIAPGIQTAAEALERQAAQLPRVELVLPPRATATNTVQAMQSGLLYGYIGLVEGLVRRLEAELGAKATVVATGGLAEVISDHTDAIDVVDQDLTLEGLRLIWELNRDGA